MGLNFYDVNPIKALFIASIIMGLLAVPLLFAIMRVTGDSKMMGKRVNTRLLSLLGWMTTIFVSAAALALAFSFFHN